METFQNNNFVHLKVRKIKKFDALEHIWKGRVPQNDEDPFKQILEILNMGSISIKKHEMDMW